MRARTTIALALLLAASGCGGTDDPAEDPTSSTSAQPSGAPSGDASSGGTREDPEVVDPVDGFLDWRDTGVPADVRYVKGPEWEALGTRDGDAVELSRDGDSVTVEAGAGRTISEVLMTTDWAVVVRQDEAETDPSQVEVVDLATGEQSALAGPPPASGGSWALVDGDLYHPTFGDGGAYCLATNALADHNGEDGWCAPDRTGWSGLTASEHGVGMMTFDDARPVACRTLDLLDDSGVPQPVDGPTECRGWDIAATADGLVWSEVPRPRRQEQATFHASVGDGYFDLGPGTTGSLVPCGDSVFFVRDPQTADEPARLMRWTPDHTLEIAYETASVGNAFLEEPVCGGGVLTVSALGEEGDEHVWADVT